jgi:6-pyruvoyltetrahydropterin/6-carboxytetrahydropterin synthase
MILLTKKFEFEAAHYLEPEEIFGKCSNMHGHTYKMEVSVTGELKNGMVINFTDLKRIVKDNIIDKCDHSILNKSMELELSTAENLVNKFAIILKNALPSHIKLVRIKLFETSNSNVEWKNSSLK